MKKLITALLILLLILSCVSCKEDSIDSLSKSDRKALNKIATDVIPSVTFSKPIFEGLEYKFCYVAIDTVASELINLLSSFEYTGKQCMCIAEHHVYIGKNNKFKFGIKFDQSGAVESVEYGANAYIPTTEQAEKLSLLLDKIAVDKNYRSVADLENNIRIIRREDDSFSWYSFKNADADRLIKLVNGIELTEPRMTDGIDYRLEGISIRLALNCEKPYITSHEKSAYLTDAQLKEIKDILERNCVDKNKEDNPDGEMPVFVKDLTDEDTLYSFTNEQSAFLIDYVSLFGYYNSGNDCSCQKEYRIYSFDDYYKDTLRTDYYIGFADGIAHIKDNNGYHLILSQKDSKFIRQIIDNYCIAENLDS